MMFARPDCWNAATCASIAAAMDRGRRSHAEIFAGGYRVDARARRSFDVEVDDEVVRVVQQSINDARAELSGFFGTPLTADEGPGFLRYPEGGFYRAHRDVVPGSNEFPRRISIVVFLTSAGEGCEGGSLRLYGGEQVDIPPRAGTLVAFPSDVPHEVLPVTAGSRDAVVDWFY
jgi:predicted 2-oxoglutarate/Fe(II)-dependent dioxygenase YbiX